VSASIAQQEAQNERLRAQGQMSLERALFDAEAKGKQFVFGAQEKREMQKLNRLSSMAGAASQQAAAAESQQLAGIGQAVGGIGSLASMGLSGGFNNPAATTTTTTNEGSTLSADALLQQGVSLQQQAAIGQAGNLIYGSFSSDRRLKKNIKQIGRSPSGLKIYSFEYKNKKGLYQGVMSDEIPSDAVIVGNNGFDMVDYSKIDVEFKLIK